MKVYIDKMCNQLIQSMAMNKNRTNFPKQFIYEALRGLFRNEIESLEKIIQENPNIRGYYEKILLHLIQIMTSKLIATGMKKGLQHKETIILSENLDVVLNQYQKFILIKDHIPTGFIFEGLFKIIGNIRQEDGLSC